MARSRAAVVDTAESDFAEIIAWYEDLLEHTAPPTALPWEPVKIGPTWQWENGWVLPELTLGWRIIAWCGVWLRDKNGQPWQFTAEQTRFILWFFAVDEHGDFLHHSAVLQRLKGWGKDPVAACLGIAALFAEVTFDHWEGGRPVGREEPSAWVQIIAVNLEQTKNTMKLMPSLISAEARRYYGIGQPGKTNVYGLDDTRQLEAVTRSPLAIEGGRPTLIIPNETQNWLASNQGHEMAGAIEGNAAKSERGAARQLHICNAYRPGQDSVAQRLREAWEATQGEDARAEEFGLLYDSLEAPPDAPLTAEDAPAVCESIRGDSEWLDTRPNGRIVKSILNPANTPSESRRKWYNQITAAEDAWTTPQLVDKLIDKDAGGDFRKVIVDGERILLFFDGSKSDDATVLIGLRISDGFVFTIKIWQRPTQLEKKRRWTVDRWDVDRIVRSTHEDFRVLGFFGDPSDARDEETGERYWEPFLDQWAQDFGRRYKIKAVLTGPHKHAITWDMRNPTHVQLFTEAAERTSTDIIGEDLRWDGHALMKQHLHNARRRPNKFGVSIGKEHRESARKVDGAVGFVGVRMMWRLLMAAPKKKSNRATRNQKVVVM